MKETEKQEEIIKLKKLAQKAHKTKESRMRIKYDALRLNIQGRSRSEIAEILGISYCTVRNYIKAYGESGVEGLGIKEKSGRTKKLTDAQEKQLYECIVNKLPKDVGFEPFVNWTAPLMCKWVLKEFEVTFSERGMRDVFYRLKLSYTRPTYTLKKADAQKQEDFKKAFEVQKKTDL